MECMLLDLINRLNYELGVNGNIAVDFQVRYDSKIDYGHAERNLRPADGIYDSELVDIVRTGSSLKIITLYED